jgi:hypothetical protein
MRWHGQKYKREKEKGKKKNEELFRRKPFLRGSTMEKLEAPA